MSWEIKTRAGDDHPSLGGLRLTPTPRLGDIIIMRDNAWTPTYWRVTRVERELYAERNLNSHYLDYVYVEREQANQ